MKKFTMLFVCLVMLGVHIVNAQQKTITGTVTSSEDGMSVPGVSVAVKGTTVGTITNINGQYSLDVPADAQALVFSFVGMKTTEQLIGGRSVIDVVLEPEVIGVDEVVVTALGISREKKSLGYASQSVGGDDLVSSNDINPISSLSGKVAGMQVSGQNFGGSKNVLIRGASSFTNNNQPLFVVDGVPISNEGFNSLETQRGGGGYDYGSMTNDLNSYDIENIEVLKGSAASALYGSRGQNGVIMISTKKGKKGKEHFSVDINSGVTFDRVSILPKLQREYGGGAIVADVDGGVNGFEQVTINGVNYSIPQYGVDESWGPKYDGQQVLHWWGAADYEKGITATPITGEWKAPDNDVDSFYETGITYTNSVNVVSTSEKSAVRFGYTNANMTGIVPNSSQKKHNFNLNGSTSLFDDFIALEANMNFVQTDTKGRPQFGYGDNSQSQKFFQWGQRQLDFEKLKDYMNPDGTMRTWNRTSVFDGTPVYSDNPYWTAYKNYQDDDRTRVFGKAGVTANFTDYLSASGTLYLDTYTFNQRERVAKGSQALASYHQWNRQATETNLEGKLNFNKNINDFSILAMLGANKRQENYSRFEGQSDGGLVVDGLYNLNNSAGAPLLDDYKREKQVNSWFVSGSVGWKNMVYVDATYRSDYDTSLPNDENNYDYSSVSASFIASELMDFAWMDNLKLRLNYGETGNGTDPFSVFNTYLIADPFGGNPQFTNSVRLKNQFLKPEITSETELGLEGVFFKNRLGFDFSWYSRETKNQIVPVEISGASGYTERIINSGIVDNSGIELLVYATPVKMGDFSWDISVNFAKNKNEVIELADNLDKLQIIGAPFGGAFVNAEKGATTQEIYAYDYAYDDAGNIVVDDGGWFVRGDLKSMGSAMPDYTAGIRNNFRYKMFDLAAQVDISKGGVYYSLSNMWGMYSGMLEGTTTPTSGGNTIREDGLILDAVIDNGDGTFRANDVRIGADEYGWMHYHGFGTPSASSVFDASYIKLREISFGYTLPKLVDVIQSIRISAYGRNLAIWGLDNKGIDPETLVGGNGNVQGLEGGLVPGTRSYGFNLQIKF
ncbi:MAG: SusC/RagA family TonB-linked outer membrane protein [Salinivirgaceae bacterium]